MATPVQFALLLVFGNLIIDFFPRITVAGVRETIAAWNAHTLDPRYFTWEHLFMTRFIGPLVAGPMLAALSRGREVTICGAFALSRLLLFSFSWSWFRVNEFPLAWTILGLNLLTPILLLTAAVWVRRSNLRVVPPPKLRS